MGPSARLLLFLLLVAPSVAGQSISWSLRTELGTFNRGYQDREYVTLSNISFGVPYGAIGAEVEVTDSEGNSWALSLAQTSIAGGQTRNWDQWEVQPLTLLNFGAISVGKDYGWLGVGVGVGGIVQLRDFPSRSSFSSDGNPGPALGGGVGWNRRESFTVLTGLFRLFPEGGPHFSLRIARGPLSLTENLMHLRGVLPLGGSQLDAELGFSSPMGLFFHGDGVLRSNERVSIGWSWSGPAGRWGLRGGFLTRTLMEGSGEVDLLRRFSVAVDWSLTVN